MSVLTWVVGAGGLLGTAVVRAVGKSPEVGDHFPSATRSMPWRDRTSLRQALAANLAGLLEAARPSKRRWSIVWCAGGGVVASPKEAHVLDSEIFDLFLDELDHRLRGTRAGASRGTVLLASSAGVWAGSHERPIRESTPTAPVSDYGRAHVEREGRLAAFAADHPEVTSVVARLTNLYGPEQNLDKPQGLISTIVRSYLLHQPVHIYVPLDTSRDYLFADDAGRALVELLAEVPERHHGVALVASGRSTTVGGLLGAFARVVRRRVPVTAGVHAATVLQPLRLDYRPSPLGALRAGLLTPLEDGMSAVLRHQMALLQAGRLPAVPGI